MKKLLPVVFALLLALLTGCGGQGAVSSSGSLTAASSSASSSAASSMSSHPATHIQRAKPKPATTHAAKHTTPSTHRKPPARSTHTSAGAGLASRGTVVTVTRVVDGDTIYVSPPVDGLTDVRLIGVDTPETHKPGTPVQPYGPQAAQFTTRMLEGKKVALETDVEKVDPYGRLLAYVWISPNTMFNEVLVRQGYAQMATFPPNVKYVDRFRQDQAEARAAGRGLWGLPPSQLCQETDRGNGIGGGCSTAPTSSPPPAPQSPASSQPAGSASGGVPPATKYDCPPGYPVKANQSGIYHVPGGEYYDETTPVRCYATPQDAEAAGYRASKR